MGTESSKYFDDSMEWDFVGRVNDMENIHDLLKENKIVGVYGMRKIGKSRFLLTLFRKMNRNKKVCLIKDFKSDEIYSSYTQYQWLVDLFTILDMSSMYDDFKHKFPGGKIVCGKCENCKNVTACGNKNPCLCLEEAVNAVVLNLKTCGTETILFLDSVNRLVESELKGIFLNFIEKLDKDCPEVKLIFCSSSKANFAHKSFGSIVLGPLQKDAIMKLLYITTESSANGSDSEYNDNASDNIVSQNNTSVSTEDLFTRDNEYFTTECKPYIEAIANLCDGLPTAAILAGTLLTEDEGLLNPVELLEILIRSRLKVLSQDHCQLDEKVDIVTTPMQQLESVFREFFDYRTEDIRPYAFKGNEELTTNAPLSENNTSELAIQDNVGNFLTKLKTMSIEKQKYFYKMFKECQHVLAVLQPLHSDVPGPTDMMIECLQRNLTAAGIKMEDEVLYDPKALDIAIRALSN